MNCKYCGEVLEENAKFCTKCGARVEPEEETVAAQTVAEQTSNPEPATEQIVEPATEQIVEPAAEQIPEEEPAVDVMQEETNDRAVQNEQPQMTEQEWKKQNYKRTDGVAGGFSIAFALLALIVSGVYICFGLFVDELNLTFAFYCALAGVIILMILSAAVRCTFTRVIRGIGYFVLLEATIVANLGVIYACVIRREYSFASITNLIPVIWLFAVLLWLLIAGVKAVALPGSRVLALLSTLLIVLTTVVAGLEVFGMISAYLNLMRITSVSLIEFFSGVSIYLVFAGLMFSELFLGWRDCKDDDAKKVNNK